MKIEYTLDEKTYISLSYVLYKKLRTPLVFFMLKVIPSILILSIPVVSKIPITNFKDYYIYVLIAAIWPIISIAYEKFLSKIQAKKTLKINKNNILGDRTLYLSDKGIKVSTNSYEQFIEWNLVREVYYKDECIIIMTSLANIPIPLKDINYNKDDIISKINEYIKH